MGTKRRKEYKERIESKRVVCRRERKRGKESCVELEEDEGWNENRMGERG